MKKLIFWLFTLAALAGGVYWAGQKYPNQIAFWKSGPAAVVGKSGPPTTAILATRDINFAVTAAGDIGPLDAVSVRPEIGGLISKLTLDIGDKVKKGDVLFELDDKDLQTEKSSRKTEIAGARLMNISGTEDHLIPYHGGPSPIPAKDGKLGFVAAEESIFLWAKAMGYQGEKLKKPSNTVGNLEVFSYLDGAIIHYKALGEGHGAAGAIDETTLLRFLENKR